MNHEIELWRIRGSLKGLLPNSPTSSIDMQKHHG